MPLPDGLKFLAFGWWLIHVLAVMLVWAYAYRRGRADERKARSAGRTGTKPGPPAA